MARSTIFGSPGRLARSRSIVALVELEDPDQGTRISLWVDKNYPYLMVFSGDPLPDVQRRSLAVTFDELKNQWGWGGFTTQDLARCRLVAHRQLTLLNCRF